MHCMNCGQIITSEDIEICAVCGKSSGHITPITMRKKVISQEKAIQQEKERIQSQIVERLTDADGDWEKKMEYIYEPMDILDGIISDYTKKITKEYPEYNPTYKATEKKQNYSTDNEVFANDAKVQIEDLTNTRNLLDKTNNIVDDIPSTVVIKNEEYNIPQMEKKTIKDAPYLYVVSGEDDGISINEEQLVSEYSQNEDIKSECVDDVKEYIPNKNKQNNAIDNQDPLEQPQFNQEQPQFNQKQPQFNQEQPQFNQGQPQFNQGQPQFNQGQPQFNQGQPQFNQGQPQFNQGQPQFNQGQPQFNQGQPQFNQRQHQFNQGQPQFNQGQPQFNQGQPQFNQGQPQFNQGQPQFNQGQPQRTNKALFDEPINNNSFNNSKITPLHPSELPQPKSNNNSNNSKSELPQPKQQQFNQNYNQTYQNIPHHVDYENIESKESSLKVFMLSFLSFISLFAVCVGIFALIPRDFKIENGILIEYTGRDTVVQIPKKVDKIGDGVFENLSFIEEIIIPESVTSIGNQAFANCTSLRIVEFHDNIIYVGQNALEGVPLFADFIFEGSHLVEYIGTDKNVTIPDFVSTIGTRAFFNNDYIETISLPTGLQQISEVAFSSCDLLETIVIPNGTTTIENSAFSGCNNLSNVTIPNSVKFIGSDAFSGTKWYDSLSDEFNIVGNNILIKYVGSSSDVQIPESITFIGNSAFRNNEDIQSVTIPARVSEIGYQSFSGCSSLETLIINEGVTTISEGAFLGCLKLKKIEFPSTIMSIKRMAFRTTMWYQNYFDEFGIIGNNTLIRYNGDDSVFEIPSQIKHITDEAFSDSPFIEAIILPPTIIHIDKYAFNELPNLQKIYCVEGSYVDSYFKNNDSLKNITVNYQK